MKIGSAEHGSCFCFSPECPCSETQEEGFSQKASCRFSQERWIVLLIASRDNSCRARQSQSRRRRTQVDSLERRAERAEALVVVGETRHVVLRVCAPLTDDLLSRQQEVPFQLSHEELLKNLQSSKRGTVRGPSGMTAEHLRPVLQSIGTCQASARAEIPKEMLQAIRMGRMTALETQWWGARHRLMPTQAKPILAKIGVFVFWPNIPPQGKGAQETPLSPPPEGWRPEGWRA